MLFATHYSTNVDRKYSCTVVDLPVQYRDRAGVTCERLLPTLIMASDTDVIVPDEVSTWMLDEVQRVPLKALHAMASAVARLFNFYVVSGYPDLVTPYDVDCLIEAYLYLRLISPSDVTKRPFPLWKRVTPDTVRRDLAAIDSFVRSCSRNYGSMSKLSAALATTNGVFQSKLAKRVNSKLWEHLDANWETYQTLHRPSPILSPILQSLVRQHPTVRIDAGKIMTTEEADAIIECTPNPSYRGLFLAMKGLGRRTSEHLHVFRSDFVTPEQARYFMDYDSEASLLIFAHPVASTFIGKYEKMTKKSRGTREEFLDRYGLVPRNLSNDKKYQAGWKGMVFYHEAVLNIPIWISSADAQQFEACVHEMRQAVRQTGQARMHPYLFVTSSSNSARGRPMKLGKVEAAFERSARKAGLLGKPGIHLHGFRHHYVWYLRHQLKLERDLIALAMGHSSVDSQDHYGTRLRTIYEAARQQEVRDAA
ncbi:site-specific integrase [Rhizobium leguminosarum]|uniref:Tyr recombinase domain-containing protein n=1 Tax=Rhizobium leguminosarum TaxID=384 RepID=A0A7K3VKY1_RHILE|nr:site-specific integrase [Rhizobium leguminosarum]NEK17452.1 hypothetical protein [Rhizobium leguminosarum]